MRTIPNMVLAILAGIAISTLSATAIAQQGQFGTADEAKAMLVKAAAAVKVDKTRALEMFNKGEGGFLDRDLYVFCANAGDSKFVAIYNPNVRQLIGQEMRALKH